MSGIYGTRDIPPRVALLSKSSPDGGSSQKALANGESTSTTASSGHKSRAKIDRSIIEKPKIPYKISGVVIERTRTRSGNSDGHSCDGETNDVDESRESARANQNYDQHQHSPADSAQSASEDILLEKDAMERNYTSLMQQLAAVLVEKETLVYQVQLLGQAYGELKSQFTSISESEKCQPSRLECLRNERHRLADYIVALTSATSKQISETHQISTTSLRTQRDLWKNKFLASSLIVDELSNQRLFLLRQFEDAQQIIIGMMEEKESIRKELFETYLYLQETKETLDPTDYGKYRQFARAHAVDSLAEVDKELAKALHRRLLNTSKVPTARGAFSDDDAEEPEVIVIPSEMEKQAKQVIEVDTKAFAASNPCEDFQRLVNERAQAAGLPPPKMHNIVVNCCRRCEGQIKIV